MAVQGDTSLGAQPNWKIRRWTHVEHLTAAVQHETIPVGGEFVVGRGVLGLQDIDGHRRISRRHIVLQQTAGGGCAGCAVITGD
jgi:hypothetical protein